MTLLACNVFPLLIVQCFLTNRILQPPLLNQLRFLELLELKTIRSLDINKAHGHDEISVKMMKICDNAIVEPLQMLFYEFSQSGRVSKPIEKKLM